MRLAPFLLLGLTSHPATQLPALQVWEKPVAPGLIYRMEVDTQTPLLVHAVRWSMKSPAVIAVPHVAGGTVFEDNATKGRGTVTEMVSETKAIGGINADFFPFTGDPLGLMVRDGELISTPNTKRVAVGWGPNAFTMGLATFTGLATSQSGNIAIDGLNEDCGNDQVVLNTPAAGIAMGKAPATMATIRFSSGKWAPSTIMTGVVESVLTESEKVNLGEGKAILVGRGKRAGEVANLKPGAKVTVRLQTSGFDWERIDQAVGGGPVLVRDGKIAVDGVEEGFSKKGFVDQRHPRTALGRTSDGDMWFVVADGRQDISVGCSLEELAKIMLRLGCVDAANLDGGGSSEMNLNGVVVNRPSDGKERPVANGVMFLPKVALPQPTNAGLRIQGPTALSFGKTATVSVVGPDRRTVPNIDVVWGTVGQAAWIDQGGTLHPLENGKVEVVASVYGRKLTWKFEVVGAKKQLKKLPSEHPGQTP